MEATAQANIPPRLKERYEGEVRVRLMQRFGYGSIQEAPRLEKITLNMGVGEAKNDPQLIDSATAQLATIAGQRPNVRRARKSIAAFKIRDGMPVGLTVTLRHARMYEFLDRLTSIAIPRIRDFRGLNARSFDGRGNYSMGVREQIIFPEIDYDSIGQIRGLDVTQGGGRAAGLRGAEGGAPRGLRGAESPGGGRGGGGRRRRGGRRASRRETGVDGEDVTEGPRAARVQVSDQELQPLQAVRSPARVPAQVRVVPHLRTRDRP
jgi:large subunit ribosomal protein L5